MLVNIVDQVLNYINNRIMGTVYNILTQTQQTQQMRKLDRKNNTSKPNQQPAYGRFQAQIPRQISMPKNVKKQTTPIQQKQVPKPIQKQLSNQQILGKMHCILIQQLDFGDSWARLQNILAKCFKFSLVYPQPLNKQGEELISNGSFIVYLLKILAKSPCVNMNFIYKDVRARYLPKIQKEKQYLQSYLKHAQEQLKAAKQGTQQSPLKRMMKNSAQKRVSFKNQLIQHKKPLTIQQRRKKAKQDKAFLLDTLQINEIYLPEQVQIVGVVSKYENIFCILQVKLKSNKKQITCIGVISNKAVNQTHQNILHKIQKQYECLSYLQLEGKNVDEL